MPRGDRAAARARGRADLLARGRPAARPARDDQPDDRGVRRRPRRAPPASVRRRSAPAITATVARALTLAESRRACRRASTCAPRPAGPGARHHRHRRLGQVVADRRAGAPVPARPGGQAAHRRARRRPHPAPGRRRAARRPDPDEQPRPASSVFFRSMATRGAGGRLPEHLADVIAVLQGGRASTSSIVETPGIGQGDAAIVPFVDRSLYVMTPEFGAASQLEKIDMLDFADVVAINKFERRGAEDARRDVGRQLVRNREAFGAAWEDMPVFGTQRRDVRRRRRHRALPAPARPARRATGCAVGEGRLARAPTGKISTAATPRGPAGPGALPRRDRRDRARLPRRHRRRPWAAPRGGRQHLRTRAARLGRRRPWTTALADGRAGARRRGRRRAARRLARRPSRTTRATSSSSASATASCAPPLTRETLSGSRVPRVALPRYTDDGELLRFLRAENLPGRFPFTAGVFPFKREGEDPARMFAGEGDAVPHQPALPPARGRHRRDAAVDRVRLGDALRPRPRRAARRLRQGRHVRASRSRRSTT